MKVKKLKYNAEANDRAAEKKKKHTLGVPNVEAIEKYFSSQQDSFTKSMKYIANRIISNPDLIRNSLLVSFSKNLDLGEASVMRFCKHLGFRGFTEFKKYFIDEYFEIPDEKETKSLIYDLDLDNIGQKPSDALGRITNLLARITIETKTYLSNSAAELNNAADKIFKANRVLVFGNESSRGIIEEIASRFISIGVLVVTATGVTDMVNKSCLLDRGDVAIAIQTSGYNKEILKIVSLLQKNRVFTIGICSDQRSELSINVDTYFNSTGPYDKDYNIMLDSMYARVSQMLIIECLLSLVAIRDTHKVRELRINALNTIEQIVQVKDDTPTIV